MGVPRYRCGQHTYDRMNQRGIWHEHLEVVLSGPTSTHNDPSQDSVRLDAQVDGRLLKVWVVAPWPPKPGRTVVVKSAAWKD